MDVNRIINMKPVVEVKKLTFPAAMRQMIDGKRVTRLEWNNPDWYGLRHEGYLKIHKPEGTAHQWIVNDGDMLADDWVVINDVVEVKHDIVAAN